MTAPFFTSYARLDDSDSRLRKTIDKVRELLRAKLGLKEPDLAKIGFFDVSNIQNGLDWEKALADGLSKSRVIVCMCSPLYLNSEYCAKEFAVFQQRLEDAGRLMEDKVAIVPVLWEPGSPPMVLPKAIARYFQRFEDRFPKAYGTDGLATLSRLRTQGDRYKKSIAALAEIIANAYAASKLKPWTQPVKFDDLPNVFHNPDPRPYNVTLTVLHPQKTLWRPDGFLSGIANLADAVLAKLSPPLAWREILPRIDKLAAALKKAAADKQISVIVADAASVAQPPWKELLATIDALTLKNVLVLVGRDDDETTKVDFNGELKNLLPTSSQGKTYHATFQISDASSFENALKMAVTGMYLTLVDADPAAKVESDALANQAKSSAIDPTTRPTVTGPGGTGA